MMPEIYSGTMAVLAATSVVLVAVAVIITGCKLYKLWKTLRKK